MLLMYFIDALASDEDEVDEEGQQYLEKLEKSVSYSHPIMPPLEEEVVYCFANVSQSVGRSDSFRLLS